MSMTKWVRQSTVSATNLPTLFLHSLRFWAVLPGSLQTNKVSGLIIGGGSIGAAMREWWIRLEANLRGQKMFPCVRTAIWPPRLHARRSVPASYSTAPVIGSGQRSRRCLSTSQACD
jgi:hypothetical protein